MLMSIGIQTVVIKKLKHIIQFVNKFTHLQEQILNIILSPNDSTFVRNVRVCDFASDHTLVKCKLDFFMFCYLNSRVNFQP